MDPNTTETYAFSADINSLLSLIINTIYSNKEIFLRELISNASDALNKIRYNSLTDVSSLNSNPNLEIKISFDKINKVLIINDSGVGMTKDELVNNLGTIASSGTKKFLESISNTSDISLIGQFGVGFYSAFLVSDKVIVFSKNNNDDVYSWESNGNGSFAIQKETYDLKRGTEIRLYLKEDMHQYLEENTIVNLIKKHNQFIEFPIFVETEKTREIESTDEPSDEPSDEVKDEPSDEVKDEPSDEVKDEPSDEVKDEPSDEVKDESSDGVKIEDETPKEKKTTTEKYNEFEQINKGKPLWTRNPKEVSDDEYTDFYKLISNDYDTQLEHSHFNVEGQIEFKGLLYVPKRTPTDFFDGQKKPSNIKLYVRKVFITDECDILPDYLKFVRGVVESNDIPLNISRETLQQNKILKVIAKNVVKKIFDMFNNVSKDSDKFRIFYEQYSKNLKLGVHEDTNNRTKLADLLRYETSKSNGDLISFDNYIDQMQEGQTSIYYITGESINSIVNSPFLEKLRQKNYEVIYMIDPLDEYVTQQIKEYKDKKLICITKENIDLNETVDEKQAFEKATSEYKNVCDYIKSVLNDEIEKVIVSNKLTNTPCILSTSEYGWTANMQRILKAQTFGKNEMNFMMGKKILEINPNSPIINKIKEKLDSDQKDKSLVNLVHLLHDATLQSSGFSLDDPSKFTNRLFELINYGLGIEDTTEEVSNDTNEVANDDNVLENIAEINTMENTD